MTVVIALVLISLIAIVLFGGKSKNEQCKNGRTVAVFAASTLDEHYFKNREYIEGTLLWTSKGPLKRLLTRASSNHTFVQEIKTDDGHILLIHTGDEWFFIKGKDKNDLKKLVKEQVAGTYFFEGGQTYKYERRNEVLKWLSSN